MIRIEGANCSYRKCNQPLPVILLP